MIYNQIVDKNKKLAVFDLDQTVTESKTPLDKEMAEILRRLLRKMKVAVVSGASFERIRKQFLANLKAEPAEIANLYLIPASGGALYRFNPANQEWQLLYEKVFTEPEKERIIAAMKEMAAAAEPADLLTHPYGDWIEDRKSQITFSSLGQAAPLALKKKWDPEKTKRMVLLKFLARLLPEYEISVGGLTSIDVTQKEINKKYGIGRLAEYLKIEPTEIIFIADQLSPGGNDYSVKESGIESVAVAGPEETKKIIQELLL